LGENQQKNSYNKYMEQFLSSEYASLNQIQKTLLKIAKTGDNQQLCTEITNNLSKLASDGYTIQAKNLTLEIMKAYSNDSNMISELKKLLTNEETANLEAWFKNNLELECPNCESHKIALNITDISIYDDQPIERLNHKEPTSVDLGNYPRYTCTVCGAEFYKYQQ